MPGFIIHIAIGERYINKHEKEIKNKNEFMNGIIAPDLDEKMDQITNNKMETHYKMVSNNENHFKEFFQDKNVDINKDFWKGYFLHLLTDYYFYNNQFKEETNLITQNGDGFYKDYDCLNYELIEKYNILIPEKIKKYMQIQKIFEKPKYLTLKKVIDFIEEISSLDLKQQAQNIY